MASSDGYGRLAIDKELFDKCTEVRDEFDLSTTDFVGTMMAFAIFGTCKRAEETGDGSSLQVMSEIFGLEDVDKSDVEQIQSEIETIYK